MIRGRGFQAACRICSSQETARTVQMVGRRDRIDTDGSTEAEKVFFDRSRNMQGRIHIAHYSAIKYP